MCYNERVAIRRNAHFHCQVDVVALWRENIHICTRSSAG